MLKLTPIRFLLLLVLATSGFISSRADEKADWWQLGNQFYAQKHYDSAVHYYELLAAAKPQNASLYFNLGNAYYKNNQPARAILNYRRSLRIDPGYSVAKDNLTFVEQHISNIIQPAPDVFFVHFWKQVTRSGLATLWAVLTLVSFLLLLFCLVYPYLFKKRLLPQLPVAMTLIWLLLGLLAYRSAANAASHDEAVVMQADVPFLPAPGAAKAQSFIPAGTMLVVQDEKGGWVQVLLPDGRNGWMIAAAIERI